VEAARREVAELSADDWVTELARLRAESAVSAGQLQGLQARVRELRTAEGDRQREIAGKQARVEALTEQQAEANRVIAEHSGAADKLAAEIAALNAQIEPAEARLAQIEVQQRQGEEREALLREQLRHAQMRKSQADLAAQRSQSDLSHLHTEIEKDLGLVALTYAVDGDETAREIGDEASEAQLPLPLNEMVTQLPVVAELPDGLDRDVRNLRAQLARLGPVNLDALAEYNEVEARYNFLTTQAADLEHAVASLQEVIAQLDEVMEREFVVTFKAIAAQFREEFVNLFGGGAAKIVLTDPDNPSESGIEIIARPPGKREQGLASLSGGERSLTAAALIFSILKKRPTPFCVLDEVDAALDEANVSRFRDAVKSLGKRCSSSSSRTIAAPSRLLIRSTASLWARIIPRRPCRSSSTAASWRLRAQSRVECACPITRPAMTRHRFTLYAMALGSVVLWGASFPLTKVAMAEIGPTSLAFLRWTISAAVLFAWLG
jgi:chromosome segregation protein